MRAWYIAATVIGCSSSSAPKPAPPASPGPAIDAIASTDAGVLAVPVPTAAPVAMQCHGASYPFYYPCFMDTGEALPPQPGRVVQTSHPGGRLALDDVPPAERARVGWCPDFVTRMHCGAGPFPIVQP